MTQERQTLHSLHYVSPLLACFGTSCITFHILFLREMDNETQTLPVPLQISCKLPFPILFTDYYLHPAQLFKTYCISHLCFLIRCRDQTVTFIVVSEALLMKHSTRQHKLPIAINRCHLLGKNMLHVPLRNPCSSSS